MPLCLAPGNIYSSCLNSGRVHRWRWRCCQLPMESTHQWWAHLSVSKLSIKQKRCVEACRLCRVPNPISYLTIRRHFSVVDGFPCAAFHSISVIALCAFQICQWHRQFYSVSLSLRWRNMFSAYFGYGRAQAYTRRARTKCLFLHEKGPKSFGFLRFTYFAKIESRSAFADSE